MTQQRITVIRGDGIGPDIIDSAIQILDKVGCNFAYDYADAGLMALENHGELLPEETLALIKKNGVALKGPLTTPVGEGFTSINVSLRKQFQGVFGDRGRILKKTICAHKRVASEPNGRATHQRVRTRCDGTHSGRNRQGLSRRKRVRH